MPGFILRLNYWDLVGTASYTLAFALVESLIIFLPFLVLAVILPARLLKNRFVTTSSIIVLISSFWMMYANAHRIDFTSWGAADAWLPLSAYLLSLAIPIAAAVRSSQVERIVQAIVARLAVLSYVYVALGCLGVIIVLVRNF